MNQKKMDDVVSRIEDAGDAYRQGLITYGEMLASVINTAAVAREQN